VAESKAFILSVYDLDLTPVGERVLSLPIRLGRSSLNDVCVAHRLVSEFHARIEEVDEKLCVRDLNSKNGVLLETLGADGAARIAAHLPVDLEPYGYEFLLSPLLRVRVRPASGREALSGRHSQAVGSVLGNASFAVDAASVLADDRLTEGFTPPGAAAHGVGAPVPVVPATPGVRPTPVVSAAAPRTVGSRAPVPARSPSGAPASIAPPPTVPPPPTLPPLPGAQTRNHGAPSPGYTVPVAPARASGGAYARSGSAGSPESVSPAVQPYASVFIEPPSGSLALPPLPGSAGNLELPRLGDERHPVPTRVSYPSPGRHATVLEPVSPQPLVPPLAHTAWELAPGTLPAAAAQPAPVRGVEPSERSIEALALRGLRELAASLMPGQPVQSAADVVQLITKLHDSVEMFCRCFIPVREACSRFIPTPELERAASERCRHGSASYVAIERALEPRAVAAALLDWRNDDHDAPRAVEHILADLMLHHLTLSQAALEGTKALLDELSPANIEGAQVRTPSMLSRLGLAEAPERALWETFADRHAELAAAGRSFRELFGEQFSRVYAAHWPTPGSGPSL
jgi:hypothetical protein